MLSYIECLKTVVLLFLISYQATLSTSFCCTCIQCSNDVKYHKNICQRIILIFPHQTLARLCNFSCKQFNLSELTIHNLLLDFSCLEGTPLFYFFSKNDTSLAFKRDIHGYNFVAFCLSQRFRCLNIFSHQNKYRISYLDLMHCQEFNFSCGRHKG